jgi:hypothetical protein
MQEAEAAFTQQRCDDLVKQLEEQLAKLQGDPSSDTEDGVQEGGSKGSPGSSSGMSRPR